MLRMISIQYNMYTDILLAPRRRTCKQI